MNLVLGRSIFLYLILQVQLSFQVQQSQDSNIWGALPRPSFLKGVSILPTDAQMTGFLTTETPARYFFLVTKSLTPVTVRITPCESPLSWRLSFLELPSEAIRSGQEDARHLNSMRHPKSQANKTPQELFSYQGNGEESYRTSSSPVGLYRLDIISMEKDTEYQLFTSTSAESQAHSLQLPLDPRLIVTSAGLREVTLEWNPSPGGSGSGIEYCVFVNRLHNYKTLCAVEASSKVRTEELGNRRTSSLSLTDAGMEMNFLKHNNEAFNESNPSISIPRSFHNENERVVWAPRSKPDIKRLCVGNQTKATVPGLRPGRHYYFDVFALHPETGASMAYTGTFAETKAKIKPRISELRAEEITDIFLMSKAIKVLRFPAKSLNGRISLFIHSCLHKARLQITLGQETMVSRSIEGAHLFELIVDQEAVYTVLLKANHKGPSLVKVLLTSRSQNLPFTSLPSDTSLRVSDHPEACSAVTVRWVGSWGATKYCIYLRRIEGSLDLRLIRKHQNSCLGPDTRPKTEVVTCRQLRGSEPQGAMTEEKIKGLKSGKVYLMDVYMFGRNNYTLKYPTRIIKTRAC
ncbi:protein NDNF-like [Pleurodeles waltl]|uniref:protein NDNF-like n=1 Tax=Pleurodeles waltl TaxID=8319 RepID=UPI0037093C1D